MNHQSLNLKAISKNRVPTIHSKNSFFSLVALLFVLVLLLSSVASTFTPFASGDSAVGVTVEDEATLRAAVNNAVGPAIIAFTTDITLTGSALNIPSGKDITLVSDKPDGFWKLTGASGQDTITVDGTLTLDGIIVTHKNSEFGRGVTINGNGILNMNSGFIANNAYDGSGGGVYIDMYSGGIFSMSGGEIVNNTATSGGGVFAWSGSFEMSGNAIIANNTASSEGGGGVSVISCSFEMSGNAIIANNTASSEGGGSGAAGGVKVFSCSFEMSGNAIIANNTASSGGGVSVDSGSFSMHDKNVIANNIAYRGGGVYVFSGSNVELLGGKVSGNVASDNGGGVFITENNLVIDFGRLFVASGVVFENNRASTAYRRASTHDAVYAAQIKSDSWTSPFTQGYNNYDISYTAGTLLTYSVSVSNSYSTASGAGTYLTDSTVTVNAGTRSGYTFSSWTVTEGGISLSNTATATFTMPARNVALTANWTPTSTGGDGGSSGGGSGGGSTPTPKPTPSPSEPSTPTPNTPTPRPSEPENNIEPKPSLPILGIVVVVVVVLVVGVVALAVLLLRKGSKV